MSTLQEKANQLEQRVDSLLKQFDQLKASEGLVCDGASKEQLLKLVDAIEEESTADKAKIQELTTANRKLEYRVNILARELEAALDELRAIKSAQ